MLALSGATVVFGLFWLCWIILTLLTKGGSALSLTLLTQSTPPPGADGGLLNAIFGSVAMAAVATIIGTPIGVLAGTYLAEYGQRGWLAPATRFLNDVRSEEHTSELQSLMRISYAVFCLKKKNKRHTRYNYTTTTNKQTTT